MLQKIYTNWVSEEISFLKQIKHIMSYNTYCQLPQESLNELLCMAVKDMLTTLDTDDDVEIGFKAKRKQVELLLEIIDEKEKEKKSLPSRSIQKISDF